MAEEGIEAQNFRIFQLIKAPLVAKLAKRFVQMGVKTPGDVFEFIQKYEFDIENLCQAVLIIDAFEMAHKFYNFQKHYEIIENRQPQGRKTLYIPKCISEKIAFERN